MSFEIVTDSSANLTDDQIKDYNLSVISLSYFVNGKEYKGYIKGIKTDYKSFYEFARQKSLITTSLPEYKEFLSVFNPIIENEKDLLYIGFSSALSGTFQSANNYLDELKEKYPDRKIYAVDSLCASMGQGLLVYYTVKLRNEGKTIEETFNWLEENKLSFCHWFTVDDLFFLQRGGRLSTFSAIAGTMLSVKPVLHVDELGKLVLAEKVRGRRKALSSLVDRMESSINLDKKQPIFISHGDCIEDAEYVATLIRERFEFSDITINYIDPVIGSHSGPGTIALFFIGNKR